MKNRVQLRSHYAWKPPPESMVKLNTDSAMFEDMQPAGIGLILRDSTGKVLMVASRPENEVEHSEVIELLAIFRGLQL